MEKKVENVLERTDDLRNVANEISKRKGLTYEDAYAEAKNLNGVTDMMEIGDINKYGEPSYFYKEAVATFGSDVNGVPTETISPEKLEVLLTANKMGTTIDFKKDMSTSDLKKQTINNRKEKEKTKEKDKVLILKKPNDRKDVNAA